MFLFQIISLLFVQFHVPSFTIRLIQQKFALIVIIIYTLTIAQLMFRTEIFKRQLFSSHAMCLHTWLTEFFWIAIACSILSFISHSKQSDECIWRRMSLPSQNLYKFKQVQCCCCLFTCLSPFYTEYCCCLFTS